MHFGHAVVTGASGGIGAAFARELASRGCDLVLVARGAGRLDQLAAEVRARHGIHAEVLIADLSDPDGLARVAGRITDHGDTLDLLVNGAGALGSIGPLARQDASALTRDVALNALSLVRLTHAALPGMLRRGCGGVINVSSVMAFLPAPGGAVYSASKAFATSFSESVHGEVKDKGVHVTALCPGSTGGTKLHRSAGHRESSRLGRLLDVDEVVLAGLAAVAAGRPVCVPGIDYRWRVGMSRVLPRSFVRARYYRRWGHRPRKAVAPSAS
jgi:short-subunit dehydrogenase